MLPLNANCAGFRLNAKVVEFPPGNAPLAMNSANESSVVVYVLEGRLLLEAGSGREVLDAGDCVCVESDMPLAWGAAGKQRCRVLAVLPGM
jgi:quercetin dioxygenase-like cupin family protein